MARQIESTNSYKDVLLKLIPSEIVGAYVVIEGVISDASLTKWITTISAMVLLCLTPFYLRRLYGVRSWKQVAFTTLSLPVWLYSIGGPFKYWNTHSPSVASAALVLWCLLIPLVFLEKQMPTSQALVGSPVGPKQSLRSPLVKGDAVTISVSKNSPVKGPLGVMKVLDDMLLFNGREATVTEVNPKQPAVRLDVDGGRHWWATNWLKPTE